MSHEEHAFRRYVQLVQGLGRLIRAGQGEGDEAEVLRAEMDSLWYAMNDDGRERAGRFLAALNRANGGES